MANEFDKAEEKYKAQLEGRTSANQSGFSVSDNAFDPDAKKRKAVAKAEQMSEAEETDALYAEELLARQEIEDAEENSARRQLAKMRQMEIQGQQMKGRISGGVKGATKMASRMGIFIAGVASALQFAFGAISLIGFGAYGIIENFMKNTTVGKILDNTVGYFFNFGNLLPMDQFAIAFWSLATLVAVCTFFGFLIWFFCTGVHVFDTSAIAIITILAFAASILPFSNLIPSILIWVIIVNVKSTFELFSNRGLS